MLDTLEANAAPDPFDPTTVRLNRCHADTVGAKMGSREYQGRGP